MQLNHLIENIDSCELAESICCDRSDFIKAALRAAKYTKSTTRTEILNDVCSMLNCRAEDLEFLFHADVDEDAAQIFKLKLPDYRLMKTDAYLEAAE